MTGLVTNFILRNRALPCQSSRFLVICKGNNGEVYGANIAVQIVDNFETILHKILSQVFLKSKILMNKI